MPAKRISDKMRANGMCWCDQCKALGLGKIRAEYHLGGSGNYCAEHVPKPESTDYSEADYATWLRL